MMTLVVTSAAVVAVLILVIVFRAWIRPIVESLGEALGWVWFVIMWTYPPILYGLGSSMHDIVNFLAKYIPRFESSVGMELLILFCFGALGIGVQWVTSSNPNTRLISLTVDHIVSSMWTVVAAIIATGAYFYDQGAYWTYWMVFPAIYTFIELVITGLSGLRNAFQKNPTQAQIQPKA